MHPIERLRYVARAAGEGHALVAREAAGALASFAEDPAGLVTACRRLVDRQPTSGPIWWLAARVLAAGDPRAEAWRAADELDGDDTPLHVAQHLPEEATVTVVGWPELAGDGLRRRGDVRVLVVDAGGDGAGFVRALTRASTDAELVSEAGAGAAAASSTVVLLESSAMGPSGFVAPSGSRAVAAVARSAAVGVWVVAGAGRVLPERLWRALTARFDGPTPPWDRPEELVPLDLADCIIGPRGPAVPVEAAGRADCPVAPELLREVT